MKRLLTILFMLIVMSVNGQTNHVEILIGKTEREASEYLNSIMLQSPNKALKIKKDVTSYGQLELKLDLPMNEEQKMNALSITLVFYKFGKDLELCTTQFIFGSSEFAYGNLSNVKDTFKFLSDNQWEKPFDKMPDIFKVTAKFTKEENTYGLTYKLVELPKRHP